MKTAFQHPVAISATLRLYLHWSRDRMPTAFKPSPGIIVRHCETRGWIIEIPVAYREKPAVLIAENEESALAIAHHLSSIKFKL